MITVEALRKTFDGTLALDGFNLQVGAGELFGLVGPNGAGKTTLIKILSTLVDPDSGSAHINGLNVATQAREVKPVIGYMPDQPGVYQDMSVREFLEFFADAFHLRGKRHQIAVELALARSGLTDRSHEYVEKLSLGMKQRLVLAKTLLHEPKVLLLDEPATGLDPIARIELRAQLKQLQAQRITILISSHILSDLEDICTNIALIGAGRNARDSEGQHVIHLHAPEVRSSIYEINVMGHSGPAVNVVNSIVGTRVLDSKDNQLVVEIAGADEQVSSLLRALVLNGVNVVRFDRRAFGLEERYQLAFGEKRP